MPDVPEDVPGVETSATVTGGETGGRRSHDRLFVSYRVDGRSYDGTRRRLVVFDPDVQVPVEVSLPRTSRTARRWMQRFTPDEGG